MATPGSSPSVLVSTTPCSAARRARMGPTVASSSALTSTTCLRCSSALVTTWAAYSTVPVTSMIACRRFEVINAIGSAVIAQRPCEMTRSSCSPVDTSVTGGFPAAANARRALAIVRLAIATRQMPGTEPARCKAIARPAAPAPTMPTRIGAPPARSASRRSSGRMRADGVMRGCRTEPETASAGRRSTTRFPAAAESV